MSALTQINNSESASKKAATLKELLSFATTVDIMLMIAGSLGAVDMGVMFPIFNILFGEIMNQLNDSGSNFGEIVG